ncbi:MAG: zinc ribbon domain-containing protein [Actinomycetia bacterium]|nr:zinc ribbon domain-containing protein [Actinomycetes bacterium]
MECRRCHRDYEDSFSFCPYCGEKKRDERESETHTEAGACPAPRLPSGTPSTLAAEPRVQDKTPQETPSIGWIPIMAIAIAVIAVVGWVLAGVFIGSGESSDEINTEALAEEFIDNVTDENYEAVFEQSDKSDPPLLGLLVSEATEQKPGDIVTIESYNKLRDKRVTREFVKGYLASIGKYLQKGNVKSIDSRKLVAGSNYVVAIYSFDSDVAFPLMEIDTGDGWKVDLSAMLVMSSGGTSSQYVVNSVEALLTHGSEESCDKAIEILEAAQGLQEKYELWLKPEAESLLEPEAAAGLIEGSNLTRRFEPLMVKAEECKKEATSSGDTTDGEAKPPPLPPPLTGVGDYITPPFELSQGLVVFHFDYQAGGRFTVSLYTESGQQLEELVNVEGPLDGSQAAGLPTGTYLLDIGASAPWTIGIEEPAPVAVPFPPQSYAAGGPMATPFFQTKGGPIVLTMNYQGSGDFVVTVIETGGNSVALVANETGPFQGSQVVSLRSEVHYLLNVEASGPWTINID